MTKLATGGRASNRRVADQGAQRQTSQRLPVAPQREPLALPPPMPTEDTTVAWGKRHFFRGCRILFYLVMPLTLLAMIAIGVLYVRLRHGPIAFDFVVAPIEKGINAELLTSSVKIDGAELRLGPSGELEFRLRDVSVLEKGGDVVLSSPLAAVNISLGALMRGRIVPARIELIDPIIALAYSEKSGFVFERAVPRPVPLHPDSGGGSSPAAGASVPSAANVVVQAPVATGAKVNLAKMLSDSSHRARQRLDATSFLTEFGISNATVVVDYEGQRSSWRIDEASVDFDHAARRSVIVGRATVASQRGPWSVSFLTDESEQTGKLEVKATIRDLVPSTLASAAPPLALLGNFETPLSGDATVDLSTGGDIEAADLSLELGKGRARLPYMVQPMEVTAGVFKLAYDGKGKRWDLKPSPVKWADGTIMFTGGMTDVAKAGEPPTWNFAIDGRNGVFEASEFGVPPVTIDKWTARGTIVPRRGFIDLAEFRLAGGGGEATVKATTQAGPQGQSMSAEFHVSPMPLNTLKALWPRAVATGTRDWVGKNVSAVDFKGGTLTFSNSDVGGIEPGTVQTATERANADFEAENAVFTPLPDMQQITAPKVSMQVQNNALLITVPTGTVALSSGGQFPLKDGTMRADNVISDRPNGEIALTAVGDLGPFIETIERLPVRAVRDASPLPRAGDGKVNAQFLIKMPLYPGVSGDDMTITGKARVSDGRFGKVAGRFDIQGFSLDLNLTETSLDAKGDLLVNGVPAKVVGQRLLGPDAGEQPPLKIIAKLDEADRTQLGFDVNDLVHGVVPVELSYQKGDRPEPVIKVHADLTGAEITLDKLQWRKASGRSASLDMDVITTPAHETELQNFKVISDDMAANGHILLGADNKISSFEFPDLNLNVISKLDISGTRSKDDFWTVDISGSNYDARNYFKSLFSVGNGPGRTNKQAAKGSHVTVNLDNVIGSSDVSLRNLKLEAETKNGNLSSLDARGKLDGGAPLVASLDQSSGSRRLIVTSSDAGQVMKLVNFYPNMQGGNMRLEVGLDGAGPAEKTGTLVVDNFRILGDPIVTEVVSSADAGHPAIGGGQGVVREVFDFNRMRAPFSVGYGQFVLQESYLKGPMLGATLRGKVDFTTKRVNIGGTYIPLQGLNGALGDIPVLGQILSGTQGEGILGMTFAVQGPTSNPQVIVNPFSLVAPGIFRDIFQMTSMDPTIQVRDGGSQVPAFNGVRASPPDESPAATKPKSKSKSKSQAKAKKTAPKEADAIDGWSSTTTAH
ncbi:MAG: AsmA-like C-terminal region-containing protein [Hyphomicrobium sp.]|uniref:YhdP family protein n=1 Tax=Hyphomicrobium sp. TaxID=82 RepID=UPI0039E7053A